MLTPFSTVFFMCLPDEVVIYGDCAINPRPDAEDLADIAIQSAASARAVGIDPLVAMISFSTGTSASGSDVDKVAEATRIVRERAPELAVDGPLQYDAAAVASVPWSTTSSTRWRLPRSSRAPDSRSAGSELEDDTGWHAAGEHVADGLADLVDLAVYGNHFGPSGDMQGRTRQRGSLWVPTTERSPRVATRAA
jgi:hypothetical protein